MTEDTFTAAEIAFLRRMLHHAAEGLSHEEAIKAVLAADEGLFAALADQRRSTYVPTSDVSGSFHDRGERPEDIMSRELAPTVYERTRAGKP